MGVLPLLDDGSCSIQGTCLAHHSEALGRCPQAFKCGTCAAWSPRQENGYTRNSGECMLNRDSRIYLDCNAPICPYYRPRRGTAVFDEWQKNPQKVRQSRTSGRQRKNRLDREAPPPTAAALAHAAMADFPAAAADAGASLLAATLGEAGELPVLLERFRGGHVRLEGGALEAPRETSLEAFYARVVLLKAALDGLEKAIDASGLGADEKDKIQKDLAGMGGSMTTFNLLFADRDDAFKGSGKR